LPLSVTFRPRSFHKGDKRPWCPQRRGALCSGDVGAGTGEAQAMRLCLERVPRQVETGLEDVTPSTHRCEI
jgi:hypothetical protein